MNANVETQGFELTPALKAWVMNELEMTHGRFSQDIRRIDVNLLKAEGPKGGKGTAAGITVFLQNRVPVRVATINTDMYAAIAISAMRAQKAVERSLSREGRWQRGKIRMWRQTAAVSASI